MNEIRLGTIGSGPIVHWILDAVAMTDGISCAAVYSRSLEKGRALAEQYGAQSVYTDLEKMLDDPEVNFIYVASPNSLHYEQVKLALQHGKNVICEKPFCTKKAQARELADLAKEKGLFLVDATPTAFLPNFELLKGQIEKVGRIRMVLCNYTQYSSRYDQLLAGTVTNVFDPDFAGGSLQDINYYNVYFNVALFGTPKESRYYANIFPGLVDTSGIMMMRYEDFVSSLAGSKDARGENVVQIEGEKGYIYIQGGSNGIAEVKVVTGDGEEVFNEQPDQNRYFYAIRNMTRLLLAEDRDAIASRLETTVEVIGVIEETRREAGVIFPGD